MSRKIYFDFDFFDYIFFNQFEFTLSYIILIRRWIKWCIHVMNSFNSGFLTLRLNKLYECLIRYCELPIYKKITGRDIKIMKFGLSQGLYDYLFNRTRYYIEFRRIFYSNKHYIVRYVYNTSYYNKLFYEQLKRNQALSNWYYGRRISINNRYINYICIHQIYYNICESYNFYMRKYLNIIIITIFRYILRYDVYIRIHMFCFVKDLRGQNRRFRELREMYYYNNKRWKLHNHLVSVFVDINVKKKTFRNKSKLFNNFRFSDYYTNSNLNFISIEDKFFLAMVNSKFKVIKNLTCFNMYKRSYDSQIIGAFSYEDYKDLGIRFINFRSIFYSKGGASIIKWFYNMLIKYYIYKYNIFNNYIYVKFNMYSTMFYLKCIHYINNFFFNILYNCLCSDHFYIYFNLNMNFDFKYSNLEYESLISNKKVVPFPSWIKRIPTSGILDIRRIGFISLTDLVKESIGRTINEFLGIYNNFIEPFMSQGQYYKLLFNRINPIILLSNEVFEYFWRKGDTFKLVLNKVDRLTLCNIAEPVLSKVGYYKLIFSGIDPGVASSIFMMELMVSKGERYILLRKRARSLNLIFNDDNLRFLKLVDLSKFTKPVSTRDFLRVLRKPAYKTRFHKVRVKKRQRALLVSTNFVKPVLLPSLINYRLWKDHILWDGLGYRTLWGRYGRIRKKERRIQKRHLWFINRIYKSKLIVFLYFILFGIYDWFNEDYWTKLYVSDYLYNKFDYVNSVFNMSYKSNYKYIGIL